MSLKNLSFADDIEDYLLKKALNKLVRVEKVEAEIDTREAQLRRLVDQGWDANAVRLLEGTRKEDAYRRAYRSDEDWKTSTGSLKWHLELAQVYANAALAVQNRRRHPNNVQMHVAD